MCYPHGKNIFIGCSSIKPEIENYSDGMGNMEFIFLEQNLHRFPDKMPAILQQHINKVAERNDVSKIILGYGLCSNGVVGLKAPKQGLIIPKVHDCITFFLGSKKAYETCFQSNPGTYYLTKSWIDAKKDPLGLMENEYTARVGRMDAEWAIKEEIKNYTHIAYVATKGNDPEKYRERAKENAAFFSKKFIEIKGPGDFILKILHGPHSSNDFITVQPGQTVNQNDFFR